MAVIELARPGQEATTYEFVITCANAAATINGIISTQLLTPMKSVGCSNDDDTATCSSDTVDIHDKQTFQDSDGPKRFTYYTLVLTGISLFSCYVFTRFLPKSKEECHEWKAKGDQLGASALRGKITLGMAIVVFLVSFLYSAPFICNKLNHVFKFAVRISCSYLTIRRKNLVLARSGRIWMLNY